MKHPFDGIIPGNSSSNPDAGQPADKPADPPANPTRRSAVQRFLAGAAAAVYLLFGRQTPAKAAPPPATTQAVGEEGGPRPTTLRVGEEGGPPPTTLRVGGECGPTTRRVGEEAGGI